MIDMGIVKSFVNSFLIFWSSYLYIMITLDIRAILVKELPPLITYQFVASLILDSLPFMLSQGISLTYIIGFSSLVFAAILIGFVSDSFVDALLGSIFFIVISIILSIPFYQFIYLSTAGGGSQIQISDRIPKGFLNMIIAIVFSIIGKMAIKEEEPILMKEIESK